VRPGGIEPFAPTGALYRIRSNFMPRESQMPSKIARSLRRATQRLTRDLSPLKFATPVTHVYNPLEYAGAPHRRYIDLFGATPKRVVFLGMNPGPFGMVQTGVPFGSIPNVRNWLKIEAKVSRPAREHPKRPVLGFECPRTEVSGARVWGAIEATFGAPERFFEACYIANYCPLAFVEESGRNRIPEKLPAAERIPLFEACDRHLRSVVRLLEPEWVVGIGRFAETRAAEVLGDSVRIGRVLHPSPANPRAQRDWGGAAERELRAQGICDAMHPAAPRSEGRRRPRASP
jgi:single-strand selective monofunctional uracil DNA glycosylase